MAKKAAKKKPAPVQRSDNEQTAISVRKELRRLRSLHRSIKAEARAVEREQDAANTALERLAAVYAERLDKVFVDRAAWNSIREEHGTLQDLTVALQASLETERTKRLEATPALAKEGA